MNGDEKPEVEIISKSEIMSYLTDHYSDDIEFLTKVNKITFGLISGK